jgi:amino acid transporter
VAIHVQAILGIVLALVLGFVTGGPLNAFALLGTVATIIMIAIYILTNLSCILYYLREQRDEFNLLLHLVVPILGILLFLPAEVAALGINFAGLGITALTYPANYAPWVIVGWMVIGMGLLVYFLATNPRRLGETAALYLQDLSTETA